MRAHRFAFSFLASPSEGLLRFLKRHVSQLPSTQGNLCRRVQDNISGSRCRQRQVEVPLSYGTLMWGISYQSPVPDVPVLLPNWPRRGRLFSHH